MTYNELYKIWHTNLRIACKDRDIDLEKFLFKTDLTKTNGCCYFTGSKKAAPKKLLIFCTQLDIPHREIFFPNSVAN